MQASDLIHNGEIVLEGTILQSGEEDWYDSGIITASLVRGALAQMDGDVVIHVNSAGGDPTEGEAIRVLLEAYDGDVTVRVAGDAMSAASLMIMGADTIEMSQGSILMIHDPSAITFGTEADHLHSAEMLKVLADTYATVYAKRSGSSPEDVRALMKAETFMGPQETVAAGFADRVIGDDASTDDQDDESAAVTAEMIAAARPRMAAAITMIGKSRKRAHEESPPVGENGPDAGATQEKVTMTTKPKTPAVEQPDPDAIRSEAVMAERNRTKEIRDIAKPFTMDGRLTQEDVDSVIESGLEADAASRKFLSMMGEREAPAPRATIQRDADETRLEGILEGLSHTMFGTPIKGPGAEYRGLTMKGLAIDLSGKTGRSFVEADMVKTGMSARGVLMAGAAHSTSDFGFVTAELMNRALRAAYDSRPGTWRRISRQRTATDFRSLHSVQVGVDTEMRKVGEDGEYQGTKVVDEGETFKVERYGRMLLITFEAVINDDLGAFQRLPQDFARGASNLESRIAWGLITANGNLSDGTALFAAGRKNLNSGGAAAIAAASVGAARKTMWEQRPLGAKATGDDFISANPDLLFVPPALEITALQFATATVPTKDSDTNPFKGTLEPVVETRLGAAVSGGSDTAWYLFDSSLPTLEHAFLQGYEAPMVVTEEKSNPKGIVMTAEHIFGAGAVEPRGANKNAGS